MTKIELQDKLCKLLKELRIEAGLSVPKMAQLVGVDKRTWQKYEDGTSVPSAVEFIDMFNRLGKNALRKVLDLIYPTIYNNVETDDSAIKRREAMCHYINVVASDIVVQQIDYLTFGDHGSNFVPQLQEWIALDHLPMAFRYSIARQILTFWQLCSSTNQLLNKDTIMPDIDLFSAAILKGEAAAFSGRNSYTTSIT